MVRQVHNRPAFDPASGVACIGVGPAEREDAAGWLPPGMAYESGRNDTAAASSHQSPGEDRADSEADAAAHGGGNMEEGEAGDLAGVADELPAFLIGDGPGSAALNGALVPPASAGASSDAHFRKGLPSVRAAAAESERTIEKG